MNSSEVFFIILGLSILIYKIIRQKKEDKLFYELKEYESNGEIKLFIKKIFRTDWNKIRYFKSNNEKFQFYVDLSIANQLFDEEKLIESQEFYLKIINKNSKLNDLFLFKILLIDALNSNEILFENHLNEFSCNFNSEKYLKLIQTLKKYFENYNIDDFDLQSYLPKKIKDYFKKQNNICPFCGEAYIINLDNKIQECNNCGMIINTSTFDPIYRINMTGTHARNLYSGNYCEKIKNNVAIKYFGKPIFLLYNCIYSIIYLCCKQKLEKIKKEKEIICPKCFSIINSKQDKCLNCGEELFECTECGNLVLGNNLECPYCYAKFEE